jgi:MOSC domain-containing protein YiiM
MNESRPAGRIVQINISPGGVPKLPIPGARLGRLGLAGDTHRDHRHHGGPDRALCLYSIELIAALQAEGHPIFPGAIGENLTLAGIDLGALQPGGRLQIGDGVVIEITGYAHPCTNIEPYFADGKSIRVSQKVHPGWSRLYARVLQGEALAVGQPVTVVPPSADGPA